MSVPEDLFTFLKGNFTPLEAKKLMARRRNVLKVPFPSMTVKGFRWTHQAKREHCGNGCMLININPRQGKARQEPVTGSAG